MRILIEVTHPAHVHFFRNAIAELQRRGHTVAVTARDKDVTVQLLENYRIPYTLLSKIGSSRLALISELIIRDFRLWNFCRRFKPDILTGISGVFASHVGFILRKPVVVWDDSEHASISHKITHPFASVICSPDCYTKPLGKKHRLYPGYHELAYLHPKRFKPDIEVVKKLGIDPAVKYCIIRFVSWRAHHDIGQKGFMPNEKIYFVKELSRHAKLYITSESQLPSELTIYRLNISAHLIHHVLAFASLCVSEGATVASESAMLAVPAIYINTLKAGTIDDQERYGLLRQTIETREAMEMSLEYLKDEKAIEKCQAAREKMLAEKIDVTDYIVQTIEQAAEENH